MYRVSAQGVDERMINVQYYYYYYYSSACFRYELGLYAVELSVPSWPFLCCICPAFIRKTTNKSAKLQIIKVFQSFVWALSKCIGLKVNLLLDHQTYCLQACVCARFSPEILQAGAMKGLKKVDWVKEGMWIYILWRIQTSTQNRIVFTAPLKLKLAT